MLRQRIAELERVNYLLNEQSLGEKYRADQAEAALREIGELPDKWESNRPHTYASENAEVYIANHDGRRWCAKQLRAILAKHEGDRG